MLAEAGENLASQTVILPGRRAGLYLKRELAALSRQPIWAPRMVTLSEFLQELTGLRPANTSELVFIAYEAYLQCEGQETFDEFLLWAHSALGDFASVDHYLADARSFFSNLRDIREIEHWSLRDEPLSRDQQHLVDFWEKLGKLYAALRQQLTTQGIAYPAMMTRHAAENPDNLAVSQYSQTLWMVGFNALSPAEQKVADHLVKSTGMRVLWDADAYYLNDENNEAGFHLREQMKRLPNRLTPGRDLGTMEKEICLHALSGEASQAKTMARLLQKSDGAQTAVVLCNENFLAPVLESIPPNIQTFNVSAGVSLAKTPLYELVQAVFGLFTKETKAGENPEIYHRHLMRFLQLPLAGRLAEMLKPGVVGLFQSHLIRNHRIMVHWQEDTAEPGLEALRKLDTVMEAAQMSGGKAVLAALERLSELLLAEAEMTDAETEYIFQLARLTRQVKALTEKYPFAESPASLKSVFMSLLRAEQMTFYGEPLTGLQILGLLETRNLDFDHVILLGANEDVLPASRSDHSLIPHDLKAVYGMPGYKHRDALFAYYFYRLIQRAKKVDVLYSTSGEGSGSGEVSRFVRQLMFEAPLRNPAIRFTHGHLSTRVTAREPNLFVKSSPEIRAEIIAQFTKGFSPSALTKFLTCPLDYYFRYVLGLGEPDEMEETPEASTFGSIVHDSLEEIYLPFVGQEPLRADALKATLDRVPGVVRRHFTDHYPEKHMNQGQNLLTYRACEHYVRNLINCDLGRLKAGEAIVLHALEEKIGHSLKHGDLEVMFSGKADRIESMEGLPIIVDYKTGSGDEKDLKVNSNEDLDKKPKAVQLMLYAWIWHKTNNQEEVKAGIIFLRNFSKGVVPLVFAGETTLTTVHFEYFEKWLGQKITSLLDPGLVFEHQPASKYCLYCN